MLQLSKKNKKNWQHVLIESLVLTQGSLYLSGYRLKLILELRPSVSTNLPAQNIDITLNGKPIGHYSLTQSAANVGIIISIPDQLKAEIKKREKY